MGICICCCCNKKNTDCLETTLIVFTSIELIFLLLGLILIEWKIASSLTLVLNIIIFIFLLLSLAILILFKILRDNETIYSKYRKLCYIFAYVGMALTILCIFLAILSESLISEKIYKYDHPCLYRLSDENLKNDNNNNDNNIRLLTIYNKTKVDNDTIIKYMCDNNITDIKDIDSIFWYNKRSAPKDIVMSYICSTIIEIFSLIGSFIWYNLVRRIKYCVKDKMIEENGLINYGPLGGYLGENSNKIVKINNNINDKNENDQIVYIRDNGKSNINISMKKGNNNLSNKTSSNDFNDKNKKIKNEMTYVQNEEIINKISENDNDLKISKQNEEEKQKEISHYSEEFY